MDQSSYITLLLIIAFITANLPWLSGRIFFYLNPANGHKSAWWNWLELLVMYLFTGLLAFGMEYRINGEIYKPNSENYPQSWEFYVVTLCLFLVLSVPGFLYRFEFQGKRKQKNHPDPL